MYIQVSGFSAELRVERDEDGKIAIRAYHHGGGSTYLSLDPAEARAVRDQLAALDLGDQPQQVAA